VVGRDDRQLDCVIRYQGKPNADSGRVAGS
jgi:hypothetical protein